MPGGSIDTEGWDLGQGKRRRAGRGSKEATRNEGRGEKHNAKRE